METYIKWRPNRDFKRVYKEFEFYLVIFGSGQERRKKIESLIYGHGDE